LNVEVGNEGFHEFERRNFDSEEKDKVGLTKLRKWAKD
jgi:hypothetical protein